jgi:ATP-grasp domain-containing protein
VKPRVLIATTDCWIPTARLGMALANAGFTVESVCPSRHPLGAVRALRQKYAYDGLKPLASFMDAIAAAQPDLIVPGDDVATRHLHEIFHRELRYGKAGAPISALIERSLGAPESFPIVYARTAFMQVAREEGIRAPKTEIIRNTDDLRTWIAQMGLPTVLKADGTSGGDGVRVVHTLEEAERGFQVLKAPPLVARAAKRALLDGDKRLVWPSLLRRRSTVNAQAFVAGREATSTVACWKGTVLAGLHFEVVHKAKSAGHATVVRLIEKADVSAAAEKIVRRLNLSGLHGFDFMLESHTGNAHLIEINPRATQVGHLTLGPERDLPAALYAVVSGQAVQPAPKVTEKDTIALFPHEWIRDSISALLHSGYHDVPWEEPDLVRACVRISRKQSAWYSKRNRIQEFGRSAPPPMSSLAKDRTVEVRCEAE